MIKLFLKDPIVTIAQLVSIIYSFPIFIFTLLTITGIPFFGVLPPSKIRFETIISAALGLFFLIFPLYLFRRRTKGNIPSWMEYTIVLMSLSPIILFIIISIISIIST